MANGGSLHDHSNYENSHSAVQSIFNSTRCYDLMQSSSKVRHRITLHNWLPWCLLDLECEKIVMRENVRYFTTFMTSTNTDMCNRIINSWIYEDILWEFFDGWLSVCLDWFLNNIIWFNFVHVFELIWFLKYLLSGQSSFSQFTDVFFRLQFNRFMT